MDKQKWMKLACIAMTAGIAIQAQAENATIETAAVKSGCSRLSAEQQKFANQLSSENRQMFCERFSAQQRKSAMMLSCHGPESCGADRSNKTILEPNAAVSKVLQDDGLSMAEKRSQLLQ